MINFSFKSKNLDLSEGFSNKSVSDEADSAQDVNFISDASDQSEQLIARMCVNSERLQNNPRLAQLCFENIESIIEKTQIPAELDPLEGDFAPRFFDLVTHFENLHINNQAGLCARYVTTLLFAIQTGRVEPNAQDRVHGNAWQLVPTLINEDFVDSEAITSFDNNYRTLPRSLSHSQVSEPNRTILERCFEEKIAVLTWYSHRSTARRRFRHPHECSPTANNCTDTQSASHVVLVAGTRCVATPLFFDSAQGWNRILQHHFHTNSENHYLFESAVRFYHEGRLLTYSAEAETFFDEEQNPVDFEPNQSVEFVVEHPVILQQGYHGEAQSHNYQGAQTLISALTGSAIGLCAYAPIVDAALPAEFQREEGLYFAHLARANQDTIDGIEPVEISD